MCPVVCALCARREDRHSVDHIMEGRVGCRASWMEREYLVLHVGDQSSTGSGFIRYRRFQDVEHI